MMLPGMQHYMSRVGMGIGPTMLPGIHNLMRLSRLPLIDQATNGQSQAPVGPHNPMPNPVNYPNQMPASSFQEQYANYMNFHSMQSASPQVCFSLLQCSHMSTLMGLAYQGEAHQSRHLEPLYNSAKYSRILAPQKLS